MFFLRFWLLLVAPGSSWKLRAAHGSSGQLLVCLANSSEVGELMEFMIFSWP